MYADVTSEIKLFIHGEKLITDNGDVVSRITNLLQNAQTSIYIKSRIKSIIMDEVDVYTHAKDPVRRKIVLMASNCCMDREHNELVEALTEQLVLEEN